jgi:hypothetical protein
MSALPKFLLIVTAEIVASVEDSWNKWYDEEHLPAALACPGVLQGFRYLSSSKESRTNDGVKSESSAKTYMAVYELSGPEALESEEFLAMRGWHKFANQINSRTQLFKRR